MALLAPPINHILLSTTLNESKSVHLVNHSIHERETEGIQYLPLL